jgi:hypothetical protein
LCQVTSKKKKKERERETKSHCVRANKKRNENEIFVRDGIVEAKNKQLRMLSVQKYTAIATTSTTTTEAEKKVN